MAYSRDILIWWHENSKPCYSDLSADVAGFIFLLILCVLT